MIKPNLNIKLIFLFKIFLIYLIVCLESLADNQKSLDNLIVIGKNEAPIKIKVFSSLTCPHCATFHTKVIPKLKENYVISGKVQIILIDFPLDQAAFNASKLLHCIDEEKQIVYLDNVYENQKRWASGSDINEINNNLKEIVKIFGVNSTQFDKCVNNETVSNKILNGRIDAHKKYTINSTPTIIINGKKLKGSADYKNIKKRIEKLI